MSSTENITKISSQKSWIKMLRTIDALLATLLLLISPAYAFTTDVPNGISLDTSSSLRENYLYIKGEIRPGDAATVERVFKESISTGKKVWTVLLNNNGGSVADALDIGRMIRSQDGIVNVRGHCYSSCALIYLGGSIRFAGLDAELGLHRPYFAVQPSQPAPDTHDIRELYKSVDRYLDEMNISSEVSEIVMATPPENMKLFDWKEIDAIIPQTDPEYDELTNNSEARRHGISSVEYRRLSTLDLSGYCSQYTVSSAENGICMLKVQSAVYWGLSPQLANQIEEIEHAAGDACRPPPNISRENLIKTAYVKAKLNSLERRTPEALREFTSPDRQHTQECIIDYMRHWQ